MTSRADRTHWPRSTCCGCAGLTACVPPTGRFAAATRPGAFASPTANGIWAAARCWCSRSTEPSTWRSSTGRTTWPGNEASPGLTAWSSGAPRASSGMSPSGSPTTCAGSAFRVVLPRERHGALSAARPVNSRSGGLEHDDRGRDAGVVGERDVHGADAELGRAGLDGAAQLEEWAAGGLGDDLGVVPLHAGGGAERLGERLLGGEPGRERSQRPGGLRVGEQPPAQPGGPIQRDPEPLDVHHVDADADDHATLTRPSRTWRGC